ncbi:BRCT domain-containing DNA repair protein [Perilla frutescens var. frutescens]|nr:BRCT domain-containing DNA repair protein [Perilla frutescens var. frutescens]
MKDIIAIRVLFSQHLDVDVLKQQKKGQKVFVTPNTKPAKDILANLVKAVHGSNHGTYAHMFVDLWRELLEGCILF